MESTDTEEVQLDLEAEADTETGAEVQAEVSPDPEVQNDPATEAFARLEGEMALMRRAVEHLAAERADIIIPDYEATLAEMSKRLVAISGSIDDIAEHPAMQVTPDSFGRRIEAAADAARRGDQGRINDAHRELRQATHDMRAVTSHARTSADQRLMVLQAVSGGALAGILLWSFFPGTIARAAPESWHWPERMARHVLGDRTIIDAGIRLIRSQNTKAWEEIAYAAKISDANDDAIEGCKGKADRAGRPVDCVLRIGS